MCESVLVLGQNGRFSMQDSVKITFYAHKILILDGTQFTVSMAINFQLEGSGC
jgi:hypothetical protein